MSTSLQLENDEKLYFQHKSLYGKADGNLFVTNLRIVWSPYDLSKAQFQSVWANVTKVKYSPVNDPKGRSAINVELSLPSPSGQTYFELLGSVKEAVRVELERVKVIISSIKKGDESSLIALNMPSSSSSSSALSSKPLPTTASSRIEAKVISDDTKKQLLEANDFIRKQYNDLVLTSKLISEGDFWLAYAPNECREHETVTLSKGKLPSFYSDSIKINDGEWVEVPETKKKSIFKIFPGVKEAYERMDELNVSEEDFWRRYAYSFRHDSVGVDEIFLRSLVNNNETPYTTSASSFMPTKILQQQVEPDINLKYIYDDYRSNVTKESDEVDLKRVTIQENDKVTAVRLLTGGWSELNRQGKLLLESANLSSSSSMQKRVKSDDADEQMLSSTQSSGAVIPLVISKELSGNGKLPARRTVADVTEYDDSEGESVFKKAKFVVAPSLRKEASVLSPGDILASLDRVLPVPEKAYEFFQSDLRALKSLTSTASAAASLGGSSGPVIGAEDVDGTDLSDQFKLEMGEVFVSVTERLRLFYTMLSRDGSAAPTPGSSAEKKILGIINDLIRIDDQLTSKRAKYSSGLFM